MRARHDAVGSLSFLVVGPSAPQELPNDAVEPAFALLLGGAAPRRTLRCPVHPIPANGAPSRPGPIAFDRDGVHVVLLDTGLPVGRGGRVGAAQRAWLGDDLRRVGVERPVVVASYHAIDALDDAGALLELLAPVNARLFVSAGDERTVGGSANAIPTVAVGRGSRLTVSVGSGGVDIRDGAFRLTASPRRPRRPHWKALVSVRRGEAEVRVERGNLPSGSHLTAWSGDAPVTLSPTDAGWQGRVPIVALPGHTVVHVNAHVPNGPDWRQEAALTLSGPRALAPIWRGDAGDAALGRLTVDGPRVLVPTVDGALVALDRRSGRRLWRLAGGGAPLCGVAASEGTVVVVAGDGRVQAVDAGDGRPLWQRTLDGAPGGVALDAQAVAVTAGGTLVCLSVGGGSVRWRTPVESVTGCAPTVAAGRAFVGTGGGTLYACDVRTGRPVWERPLGVDPSHAAPPASAAAPVVDGDLVLALSATGLLRAVRASTGELRWSAPTAAPELASVWLSESGAVVGSARADGALVGFDRRDGTLLWRTPTDRPAVPAAGAISDGVAVVGSEDGTLWAVQTGSGGRFGPGSLLWRYRLGPGSLAMPAARDGVVYAAARDGVVVALPIVPPYLAGEPDR